MKESKKKGVSYHKNVNHRLERISGYNIKCIRCGHVIPRKQGLFNYCICPKCGCKVNSKGYIRGDDGVLLENGY